MSNILLFEAFTKKEEVDKLEDYFLEWIDSGKYNSKIIKSPAKYNRGDYGNGEIRRKSSYVVRFEVLNNIESIKNFTEELLLISKRWGLSSRFHKVKDSGTKVIFDLPIAKL